jgi:uncharacterized membrane protein
MNGHAGATNDVERERPTERMPPNAATEDATRRLEEPIPTSYPSVFVPPVYQPPANYPAFGSTPPPARQSTPTPPVMPPYAAPQTRPSSRTLPGLGLPENIAMILPYAPFYIGIAAGLIELFLVPRSEYRTRFHAAQGLALQAVILAITLLFSIIRFVPGSGFGGTLFSIAALVFLIVSMVRVWKGENHRITALDDLTRWINQQIEPRK